MKAYFVWTAIGPQVILTSCNLVTDSDCLRELARRDLKKFVAHEVPLDLVKRRYGTHYDNVLRDPKQKDALRVVDEDGRRVLNNLSLKDLGPAINYEA